MHDALLDLAIRGYFAFGVAFFLAEAEPISGGGGWVGAGLLGCVLAWLMFRHLPDKDRQLKDIIESKDQQLKDIMAVKDEQLKDIMAVKDEQLKEVMEAKTAQMNALLQSSADHAKLMHEENQRALERIVQHCEKEIAVTNEILRHDLNELGDAISELTSEMRQHRDKGAGT